MVSMSRQYARNKRSTTTSAALIIKTAVACGFFGLVCFYGGFVAGRSFVIADTGIITGSATNTQSEVEVQKRIQQEVRRQVLAVRQKSGSEQHAAAAVVDDTDHRFPTSVHDFAVGISRVDRDDFAAEFGLGVPLDPSTDTNKEVLIFYASDAALPSMTSNAFAAQQAVSQTSIPLLTAKEAVDQCDFVNLILTDHSKQRQQCIAVMGQYEAFHVQKYMRLPEHGKLDSTLPLRFVNRGAQPSGRKSTKPPSLEDTQQYWSILTKYLTSLDSVLEQLKPIAETVAVNNSIIVLVCNFGQSELLMNFVCAAQSRDLDLKAVLVFATDQETYDLATSLGVTAFFDETNFGDMPKEAAGRYADKTFTSIMMAKLYCVQMISMLGYDVLFQDVDLVWYRDPLEFFHDETNPVADFDTYFQDDGNHGLFYAPYSANTGFYYIRANERTRHFFNSFLMAGDLILATHSHQVPLVALLAEHASMYGLRIKIFSRSENDWPGGHAFHRRHDFMKDVISGVEHPYIFHMSWTHNKDNKIKFFQQLGEWRVHEKCIQATVDSIQQMDDVGNNVVNCCLKEPVVTCHYRDKPSKIPCQDSPPIDQGRPSFW